MPPSAKAVRQIDIDTNRGLGVLLVVYVHALAMFMSRNGVPDDVAALQVQFLTSFGIPGFFLMSGFVYRVKTHRRAFTASLTLLFLAYACHVVGWLLHSAIAGTFDFRSLVMPLVKQTGLLPVAIWFIAASAFVQLIYHFAERASTPGRWLIYTAVVALFVAARLIDRNYFYVGAWAPGLLFLAAGHVLAQSRWLYATPRTPLLGWLSGLGLMALVAWLAPLNTGCEFDPWAACLFANGTFSVSVLDGRIGFVPLFLLTAPIGCCAFWLIGQRLARHAWSATRLARIGRHSLALYTLNAFVLSFVQPQIERVLPAEAPTWLVLALPLTLTLVQVPLLRWWRPVNDALLRSASRVASAAVDRASARRRRAVDARPSERGGLSR